LFWQQAKTFVVIDRQLIIAEDALGLYLSQTTFTQATKNLHQTLCPFKITFIVGYGFNPLLQKWKPYLS
jgi:hypothetical protein